MIEDMEWFNHNLKNKIPFGFARFNDGEMMGINQAHTVVARGDQYVDEELSAALKSSLEHKQENYYIGVPCSLCYPQLSALAKDITGEGYEFLTKAVVTTNKNWKHFVTTFPEVMGDRRLIWIGGNDQDTEPLKEMGLNIVNAVKLPRRNSWNLYEGIKKKVSPLFQSGDVVAISLGPTARVLVRDWFQEYPDCTFIDIGSNMDPFTRGVRHNCHKGWEETGFNIGKPCKECN